MSGPADTVAFFHHTFEEALGLTREARDYLAHQASGERAALPLDVQLVGSCEIMRLTARLTQVMAWLLVQKAVHAGEMTRAQAASAEHRLAGQSVCLPDEAVESDALPPRLADLLERSHSLYLRVARLDAMLAQDARS